MYISKAIITDTEEVAALVNSAYRGETAKLGWTSESHLLDGQRVDDLMILSYLQDETVTILKYVDADNQITGCVYLEQRGEKLYLGMLTVSPLQQAKGIGKKLLAAADEYGAILGSTAITITVITTRSELLAWYERHGYHKTGEIRPLPNDKRFGIAKQYIELYVMEKPLL